MSNRIGNRRTIYEGTVSLHVADLLLDSGETAEREVVAHPEGAAVLLYDPRRRTALMISETRLPVEWQGEQPMLEVVAGTVEDGDYEGTARREALEEAGIGIGEIECLGTFWATPATSTERVAYFLAPYSSEDRISPGGGLAGEGEYLRVKEVALAALWRMLEAGELQDAKTVLLLQALRLRRSDLFAID